MRSILVKTYHPVTDDKGVKGEMTITFYTSMARLQPISPKEFKAYQEVIAFECNLAMDVRILLENQDPQTYTRLLN